MTNEAWDSLDHRGKLAKWFELYGERLIARLAPRFGGTLAEEGRSEANLKYCEREQLNFACIQQLDTWMWRVAWTKARDQEREGCRLGPLPPEGVVAPIRPGPLDPIDMWKKLQRALDKLEEADAALFRDFLRKTDEMDYRKLLQILAQRHSSTQREILFKLRGIWKQLEPHLTAEGFSLKDLLRLRDFIFLDDGEEDEPCQN